MEPSITTQVVLKLPNGKDCGPFSISSTSEVEVLDELPKLFTAVARQPIPGTKFYVETPQSTCHIYVTSSSTTSSPLEAMEVYAIEVGKDQQLSKGEVQNRFYDSFGMQLKGAIRVVSGPETEDAGEGRYPCGTLLCITGGDNLHTSSQESPLCSSPVVATSDSHNSAELLVAGNQDVTVPQASDSQSPGSFREGPTHLSHPPQETAMHWTSAIKLERKSNCEGTSTDADHPPARGQGSDSTDVAFNTASKLNELTPSTQCTRTVVLSEAGSEQVQVVEMEESSPNSASSQEETSSNHRKSAVVTGMHRRTYSDVGVYERSDEAQNDIWVRTLSDSNIVELKTKDGGLLPRDGIQETGSALRRRKSKFAPIVTNSSSCEPTQPILGQHSENNETVMEGARPTFGMQGQKQSKPKKLNVTEVAIQEEQEEDEKMESNGEELKVTFVVGEESSGDDDDGHSPYSKKESYEDYSSWTSSWTSGSEVNMEVMQRVHVLEHACNGRCFQGSVCTSHLDRHFAESVREMQAMVRNLVDRSAADESAADESAKVKEYIQIHCSHCNVAGCRVPHVAAGCLPPKSVPPRVMAQPVGSVSYDLEPAFMSTSSDLNQPDSIPIPKPTGLNDQPSDGPPSHPPTFHTHHNRHAHNAQKKQLSNFSTPTFTKNIPPGQQTPSKHPRPPQPVVNDDFIGGQEQLKHRVYNGHRPVYRVTDGSQTATGMGFCSYLEPDMAANAMLRQARERSPCPLDVGKFGFPKNLQDSYDAWYSPGGNSATLIYSSQELRSMESDLVPGFRVSRPNMKKRDQLGCGGNGVVFKFTIRGKEFAVKSTRYRPAELNVWHKMDCPNIIPLYGVMLDDHDHCKCFQLMPKMTTDLREVFLHQKRGYFCQLIKDDPKTWKELVQPNAWYILHEVLQGLSYLHEHNIQHGDLKAKNILIKMKCTCPDALHCCCPRRDKCEVRIADFDAVRRTEYPTVASSLPNIDTTAKTPEDMRAKLGTLGYRALEQFQQIDHTSAANHNLVLAHKKVVEGSNTAVYDLDGPWCDVWSLGVIILQICLGSISEDDKMESWHLHHQPHQRELTPQVEATCACLRLKKLLAMCLHHRELWAFGRLAERCLVVEFRKRPTPEELLNDLFC